MKRGILIPPYLFAIIVFIFQGNRESWPRQRSDETPALGSIYVLPTLS